MKQWLTLMSHVNHLSKRNQILNQNYYFGGKKIIEEQRCFFKLQLQHLSYLLVWVVSSMVRNKSILNPSKTSQRDKSNILWGWLGFKLLHKLNWSKNLSFISSFLVFTGLDSGKYHICNSLYGFKNTWLHIVPYQGPYFKKSLRALFSFRIKIPEKQFSLKFSYLNLNFHIDLPN